MNDAVTWEVPAWLWAFFGVLVVVLLVVDLLAHRKGVDSTRSAIVWSIVWVGAGLAFNVLVWVVLGALPAQEYLAAYLIEKSLSVDNLFVFLVIFKALGIQAENQRRALSWGIFGAVVFRALFIFAGIQALERWQWVVYVFGGILFVAAIHIYREDPAEEQESKIVAWLKRHLRVAPHQEGHHFFVRHQGRLVATPLFLAVLSIELTDVAFAVDSVPAALAITQDLFLVYSSNVFAILGLRALYIALAKGIADLRYLHYGLAGVLAFAGLKMVTHHWVKVHPMLSVGIILVMIGAAVWASVRANRRDGRSAQGIQPPDPVPDEND